MGIFSLLNQSTESISLWGLFSPIPSRVTGNPRVQLEDIPAQDSWRQKGREEVICIALPFNCRGVANDKV